MSKIGIIGVYGEGEDFSGGQPVKTKLIIDGLTELYNKNNIVTLNTFNWKKNKISLLKNLILMFIKCDYILLLPAKNGIRVFSIILSILNLIFKRKIMYIVIGGWLPDLIRENRILSYLISNFFGVYVETTSMKKDLEYLGFTNVEIMNNFKVLSKADLKDQLYNTNVPYKICTFSRVVKEKGIEDAINSVKIINEKYGSEVFSLDIYGKIDESYEKEFTKILNNSPSYINYCGTKKPTESVDIIKKYFILLFPTHYRTEGIPGTIIDSYYAGVPVLSSKWNSFSDVIEEGKTGMGYDFKNLQDLTLKLENIIENPEKVLNMKKNCLERANIYSKEYVLGKFIKKIL